MTRAGLRDAQAIRLDPDEPSVPGQVLHAGVRYDPGASAINNRRGARELRAGARANLEEGTAWLRESRGVGARLKNAALLVQKAVVSAGYLASATVSELQADSWERRAGAEGMARARETYGDEFTGRSNGL